jgi:AMP-activated protein kinase-like protein
VRPTRRAILSLAVAASLSVPVRASAQRWQVDLAGNTIGYDTTGRIASASIAPLVEWNQPTVYATLSGALAAFEGGQWTSQGHGDISYLFTPMPPARGVRTELVGSADGSAHSSGYRTASTRGEFRIHLTGRSIGLWIGGTAATGWTTASSGVATAFGPTAAAWGRSGDWSATIIWDPFRLQGGWYPQVEGRVATSIGSVDLQGSAGWRQAPTGSGVSNVAWGGGSTAVWFTPRTALVLSAGSYPSDLLQTLPRGRYMSVAIRLARHRPAQVTTPSVGRTLYTPAQGEGELRFNIPGASRVDIVGDWTKWSPVPLIRSADGRWSLAVKLAPGVHRFNLVVDGNRWIAPDEVGSVDDGFGGKISLIVVP